MKTVLQKSATKRLRINVRGVVQGVGFRPFVFVAANTGDLKGFVGNEAGGVFIEVEGSEKNLDAFLLALRENAPPLAHISKIEKTELALAHENEFRIVESSGETVEQNTFVSPDVSVCADCLAEMFDSTDRRYLHPFINCTNCGTRFTIQRNIPYDRANTTMSVFEMCENCRREYENPADRRFHAQPISCLDCGVKASFQIISGESPKIVRDEVEVFIESQRVLRNGEILAIKGIGGFHLACDAQNDAAVALLRTRKNRAAKPLAVMVKDLETARRFAKISETEAALLSSREKPIVLLRKKNDSLLSEFVAPGNANIGVMLPYAPLHHLLFHQFNQNAPLAVLVMTSGNFSDEPIVKDNQIALEKLSALADAFLLHDREIYQQCDDSVVRVTDEEMLPVRRSRGYAPFPIELPFEFRKQILAVGGELKNAFALGKANYAVMSPHIGNMESLETLCSFENCLGQMRRLFEIEPEIVASDLHPAYLSSVWAQKNLSKIAGRNAKFVRVQHHQAHVASVMAENAILPSEKVIGFAFDGTGYGADGSIWGGEVFAGDYRNLTRRAHFEYVKLAGGDASIVKPYRAALAFLHHAGIEFTHDLPPVAACPAGELKILQRSFAQNFNVAPTSSAGRLFDAVASIAGGRQTIDYEAQAAIEFEAALDDTIEDAYEFEVTTSEAAQISVKKLIRQVVFDVERAVPVSIISAKFHNAVADLICRLALDLRAGEKINKIALSGGTFQNVALLGKTLRRLRARDFEVLTHSKVPPNDGGLALGQAVIANFLN